MANHPIVHLEIPAQNLEAAGNFYAQLFDWNVEQMPEMQYATFRAEGGPGGGFTSLGGASQPGNVLVYVYTDDIDASLAKAEQLGGKTVEKKQEIPGIGWFGVFTDPTGNRIALFTPNQM